MASILQRRESKFNNETGFKTIEQQQLVAVETDETKSASQLTMEQLQLVPEDPHFHDDLNSDSDSDDSSDDEYELDLAAIDEFLGLHTEPEHVQLIKRLDIDANHSKIFKKERVTPSNFI